MRMNLHDAIAPVLVVVLLLIVNATAVGFASDDQVYTATSINSENTLTTDYFTAGIYEADGTTPVSKVIDGSFHYSAATGGGYHVSCTDAGRTGILLIAETSYHIQTGSSYTITGTWAVTGGAVPAEGSSLTCYVGNESEYTDNNSFRMYGIEDSNVSTTITVESVSSLELHFDIDFQYTVVPSDGTTIIVCITIIDGNHATIAHGDNTLTITAGAAVDLIGDVNDATVEEGDSHPSYTYTDEQGNDITVYLIESQRSDGNTGVYISSDDDSNSLVNTSAFSSNSFSAAVNIPQNTDYAIQVTITGRGILSGGSLDLELEIGDDSYTGTINDTGTYFAYTPTSGNRLTLTRENSPNHWLNNVGPIVLKFSGESTSIFINVDIKLQIVFRST